MSVATIDEYGRTWLEGRRVLIADDVPLRRAWLEEQLARWSVRLKSVGDADGALDALQGSVNARDPFDAVLVGLSAEATFTLTRAIDDDAHLDEVTMVVLASGEVDMARLRRAGVSVCLTRPVSVDVLRGTLLEQLAGVASQPLERSYEPRQQQERILVVDDSPVNQMVASGLLSSMGYVVDVAGDGAAALLMIDRQPYAGVLMDVQMPVLDGYATTRALRSAEGGARHLPVIAMTAAAVEGERERCLDSGMDDFLTKPVDPVALAATLERWLDNTENTENTTDEDAMDDIPHSEVTLAPTAPIAGLDVERLDMLRDLDPGETTYIDRAIGNFQVNSVAAVETIERLIAEGDPVAVRAAAHKIAGSALNLGAPRAGEAARAVELLADAGTLDGVDGVMPELVAAMAEARTLLLAYRATYQAG